MENKEDNLNDKPKLPLSDNGDTPFGLPQDYFASFEDKLKQRMEFEDELAEFSVLSSLEKQIVFTTPDYYFLSLENNLEHKQELEPYAALSALKKTDYPVLEEDYKQQFESVLNYRIELIDELKSYPALYAANKVGAFIFPEGYFETLTDQIKERVYASREDKLSVWDNILALIFGRRMAFTLGALCILAVIIYIKQPQVSVIEQGDCKTLACLERQEILNNKAISNFDEDQLMELVDVNALNKQLNLKEQKTDSLPSKEKQGEQIDVDDLLDEL